MRRGWVLVGIGLLGGLALMRSAGAEEGIQPVDPKLDRPVEFYRDVYPILEAKCLACHNAAVAESDLVLETPEGAIKGGASGEAVIPGKPDDSYLYEVAARVLEPVMPPLPNKVQATAVTPAELGILRKWIEEGAKSGERKSTSAELAWQPIPETYKAVYSVDLSPSRQFLAVGRGNRILIHDLTTQQEVARLTDPSLMALRRDGAPLYSTGVAQRDFVHSLAFSPDGQYLASGGYRVAKLWKYSASRNLASLNAPGSVEQISINAAGTLAAVVSDKRTIRVWSLEDSGQRTEVTGLEEDVAGVALLGDKVFIAAAAAVHEHAIDGGARTRSWTTPQPITAIAAREGDNAQVITAHADNVIRVWPAVVEGEAAELMPLQEIKGHGGRISQLKMLDGSQLLSASDDATVRLWNVDDGKQLFSQNVGGQVLSADATPDQQWIVASGSNNVCRIWSKDGKQVAELKGDPAKDQAVTDLTDEQTVAKSQKALADQALKAAEKDLEQRKESLTKAEEAVEKAKKELAEADTKLKEAEEKAKAAESALAEKPEDGGLKKAKEEADKALTAAQDAQKKAADAVTSAERTLQFSKESVGVAEKSVASRKAADEQAATRQSEVEAALKAAQEAAKQAVGPIRAVAVSPTGQRLATLGPADQIHLWDAATGQPLETLPVASGRTKLLYTSATTLLVGGGEGPTEIVDVQPRWSLAGTLGASESDPLDISQSPFADRVLSVAFGPDGKLLATGGGDPSRSGELILWNVETRKIAKVFEDAHSDTVFDIEFSRDGKQLVSGAADKFVKLFDIESGELVRSYEGHTGHVLGVAMKADGSTIASAGADNAIKVWNAETGEQNRTISNYSKQVTSVDFVGVSDNLISGSGDKGVKFHRAANGQNYRSFGGNNDFVYETVATGDEKLVISAGEDGVVRVWDGSNGKLLHSIEPPQAPAATAQK